MTSYINPSTRNGGVKQIVVPPRQRALSGDEPRLDLIEEGRRIYVFSPVDVDLVSVDADFVQVDISSLGLTSTPDCWGISQDPAFFCYEPAGGVFSATSVPIGVSHRDGTSTTATVSIKFFVAASY